MITRSTYRYEISYKITRSNLHVENVFVQPKYRKKGIARKLIKQLIKENKETIKTISLDATYKSRKVWKKIGFTFQRYSYSSKMLINKFP